jgi:quercetin 2,3-dioxygenase
MISIIGSETRHHRNFGWLDTRWHFSFGDYVDPDNTNWGPLRVFNDDLIQGGGGFEPHPHRDMEIVTYVIDGELAHSDNLGNGDVIHPGEVQVMSAGKRMVHAEFNNSKTRAVHLLQLWIMPRSRGLTPRWEQKPFSLEQRSDRLLPVASGSTADGALRIDQDATVYVSSLRAGRSLRHDLASGRRAYLFLISGGLALNERSLGPGDQARIEAEDLLRLESREDSELMLLDLP